jgi:predicted phage baseplate assembly protein
VDDTVLWLSQLRDVAVRFKSEPLDLLPVPIDGELSGSEIELDGVSPGIEPGRLLIVQGERIDLPAGATVTGGEPAMVSGSTLRASDAGAPAHTVVTLAGPLAYRYRLSSVIVFGNVAPARQGVTTTERPTVNGSDPAHPTFTLAHAPILADPDPCADGARLALTVRVEGRAWERVDHLDQVTPGNQYMISTDGRGRTVIILSRPVPASAEIEVSYRSGSGGMGNLRANQLTQLMTRPMAVASASNPLAAAGGSDGDAPDEVRERVPLGSNALGRLVSVSDFADLARSWAGIGKADAVETTDGRGVVVAVTLAGTSAQPLNPAGPLVVGIKGALEAAGDATLPIAVLAAQPSLIVVTASVGRDPAWTWRAVATGLHAALTAAFGYQQRSLGQDVLVSDFVAIAHQVPGVTSFTVTGLGLIPLDAAGSEVSKRLAKLPPPPADGRKQVADRPFVADGVLRPSGLAYLSADLPDTLMLKEAP